MKMKILCPGCNSDITSFVNKTTAHRAGMASRAKHDKKYYQALAKHMNEVRWGKKATKKTT